MRQPYRSLHSILQPWFSATVQLAIIVPTLIFIGTAVPLLAVAEQQLSWRDLGVTVHPSDDPFFSLAFEDKRNFEIVLEANGFRNKGLEVPAELGVQETMARKSLEQSNFNVEQLIKQELAFREKLENQGTMVRSELDGENIRIPGYVVPLDFDGLEISEFLLVPFAGACIHTPPPPPSQIIHVRADDGFEIADIFTPVWVSGELKVHMKKHSAELSDGASSFDVGYQISSGSVEMYN